MSMIVPPSVVEPFCADGVLNTDYNAIPVPDQTSVSPENASYSTGFPPATRRPRTSGGIPPRGKDMNGILRATTAHTAWAAAGAPYTWNSDVVTVRGGYPVGAMLRQAADLTAFWVNMLDGNTSDPDTGGANWMSTKPLLDSTTPTAGSHNDLALPGASDFYYDVDTTSAGAAVTLTGFVAQRDGQRLIITNTGPNGLTITKLDGGSAAANRVRSDGDIMLTTQYASVTIQYSQSIGKWIVT